MHKNQANKTMNLKLFSFSWFLTYNSCFKAFTIQILQRLYYFKICIPVVLYYQANKAFKKIDADKKEAELKAMKAKYGLNTPGREATAK